MESQDGLDVRSMRLKILYTFDNENKTNFLARWPHVLDIQTGSLDENTSVGVIELKTCIQAIVSASPELVAQSGKDYTVYAYDYSEHETPLVGQGMLSWLLASSSPALEAPAHQSTTMVPGRVCKIPLGIFSEGAQETLEVRLQLVPVSAIMQTRRESSNVIPLDFDTKPRKIIVRQTPAASCASSSANQYGIEKFHQFLSEGSIPRGLTLFPPNQSVRSVSPPQPCVAHNRISTPGSSRMTAQVLPRSEQNTPHIDVIPPSSSASIQNNDFQTHVSYNPRRGSIQPGYCSGRGELVEPQTRKKAKVYQANWPGKLDSNMERRPSSLLVAACIPASVRIHRPTTVNPVVVTEQSAEEPPRPPIPISQPFDLPPQGQPSASIALCSTSYTPPYFMRDDLLTADLTGHSPEDSLHKSLCDPSFTMLSSPPFIHGDISNRPSPDLLPISLETSSGFLSGDLKDLSDEGTTAPLNYCVTAESCDINRDKHNVRTAVQASSLASAIGSGQGASRHPLPVSGTPKEQTSKKAQAPLPRPATSTGSRPSSSAGARVAPTPPALAILQSDVQIVSAIPASDPVVSIHHPVNLRFSPCTTGSTKRSKQVQARLDQAIREGQVPSYCENCGSIETPTWRRAWSKDVEGSEKDAEVMMRDSSGLFWLALEHNAQGKMQKFKIYKKGPGKTVNEWVQMLFCNPCGLWLYRFKSMRPENRWNEKLLEKKRKRPLRNRKTGPFSSCPASRTRSKAASNKPLASSPAPTELSFIPTKEETPDMSNTHDNGDEADASPHNRRRDISAEPRRLTYTAEHRWHEQYPMEDLQRAFQSNPERNMEVRLVSRTDNKGLTPKHVRRSLSPTSQKGPLIDASFVSSCSPQCNARIASKDDKRDDEQENHAITPHDDPGRLFKSPTVDFDLPTSPTPRRHHLLIKNPVNNRLSLPSVSPSLNEGKNMSSPITPAHLSVERMRHIRESQQGPRSQQRQQISPNKQHIFPSLPHGGLHSQAFEYHTGMILDIFDGASSQPNSFLQLENTNNFVGDKWADLLPSNYVSTADSDDGPSDDIQKINILDSEFNNFKFSEFGILDTGLFSSDAPHTDPFRMGTKKKPAGQEHGSQQAISLSKAGLNFIDIFPNF